jgi:hypothetical protein
LKELSNHKHKKLDNQLFECNLPLFVIFFSLRVRSKLNLIIVNAWREVEKT